MALFCIEFINGDFLLGAVSVIRELRAFCQVSPRLFFSPICIAIAGVGGEGEARRHFSIAEVEILTFE